MVLSFIVLSLLVMLVMMLVWSAPIPRRDVRTDHVQVDVKRRRRVRTASSHRDVWLMPDLSKRRAWFAEDEDNDTFDGIDMDSLDPSVRDLIVSQRQRIKELNHESAGKRKYIERIETEREAERRELLERLEKTGDYKRLAEEREKELAAAKLDAQRAVELEKQIQAANELKIAQVPDDFRDALPDLPPEKLSVWLDQVLPKLQARVPEAPDLDASGGGDGKKTVKLTPELEEAYQVGGFESREEFVSYMKKAGMA